MPVSWRILEDAPIMEVTGSGLVTEAEYLAAHAEWFALPPSPAPMDLSLADWSAVTTLDFRSDAVRQSVEMTRDFVVQTGRRGRMAIVARTPAVYGMCRMWQLLFEGTPVEVQVFRDRDEGLAWLRSALSFAAAG